MSVAEFAQRSATPHVSFGFLLKLHRLHSSMNCNADMAMPCRDPLLHLIAFLQEDSCRLQGIAVAQPHCWLQHDSKIVSTAEQQYQGTIQCDDLHASDNIQY